MGEKRGGEGEKEVETKEKEEKERSGYMQCRPLALLHENRGERERERRKGRLLSLTSLAWSLVMAVLSSPGLYYLYSTIIPVSREKGEG